jgi:RHS repeat-associated protein
MRHFLLIGFAAVALSARANVYITPVATAKVNGHAYVTATVLKNSGSQPVRCESVYAISDNPKDGTLRAIYEIEPNGVLLDENTLMKAGAVGTIRFDCSGSLLIAAHMQASSDGGKTFDSGRFFRSVGEENPVTAGTLSSIKTRTDLLMMEVEGRVAQTRIVVKDREGRVLGQQDYEIVPFGEQIVNLSSARAKGILTTVEISLKGGGAVVITPQSEDASIAALFKGNAKPTRSGASSPAESAGLSAIQLLGISAFKAAPFVEPMTGHIYMRGRWYDPRTGTFLTPDPAGYRDSASLYSYCGGDPVNCSDPTGNAASVNLKGDISGRRPDGTAYQISAAEARMNPVGVLRVLESDPDLGFGDQEWVMTQAHLPIPYSSGCRKGEACIESSTPNNRAFRHLPRSGETVKDVVIAASGLPPQTREQEITSGVIQIASTAGVITATKAYAGAVIAMPADAPIGADYLYDVRTGRYRETATGRFVAPRNLPYPPNAGFAVSAITTLLPGAIVDRYGRPSGRFAGQPGNSIAQRGLPPGSGDLPYKRYLVMRPVQVEAGPAAEVKAFGAGGGGTQYQFKKSISDLIREGVLQEIP